MSSLLTDSKDVNFYPRSPCGERLCQLGAIQPVADISIHALLAESDDRSGYMIAVLEHFYPRSPCGERPVCHPPLPSCPWNFYPRSPCGERPAAMDEYHAAKKFLSTLSLRRATCCLSRAWCYQKFLSTLSLRRATVPHAIQAAHIAVISIHALLAESDYGTPSINFQSHSFLSTLSLRRATSGLLPCQTTALHFYPRSPCGERRTGAVSRNLIHKISIHALLAESDISCTVDMLRCPISIHALLAESDGWNPDGMGDCNYFYPRSPCGERPILAEENIESYDISIHALLAESDAH